VTIVTPIVVGGYPDDAELTVPIDRAGVQEFRRAMFWAACAAQCAEEPSVSGDRIVSALLRTRRPSCPARSSRP
jgi:hypothetical protein